MVQINCSLGSFWSPCELPWASNGGIGTNNSRVKWPYSDDIHLRVPFPLLFLPSWLFTRKEEWYMGNLLNLFQFVWSWREFRYFLRYSPFGHAIIVIEMLVCYMVCLDLVIKLISICLCAKLYIYMWVCNRLVLFLMQFSSLLIKIVLSYWPGICTQNSHREAISNAYIEAKGWAFWLYKSVWKWIRSFWCRAWM